MTRNRAILAATSAATALLLVAGCDSDTPAPPPETETTAAPDDTSPSPSPSESAVVVAPERPAAMDDDGPAGAEAAAVYFLELDDYIMKTGDTAEWEAMSHKSCKHCAARLDQAQVIAERGDTFTGGESKVEILHTYQQDAATGIWPIDVRVQDNPSTVTDSSGEVVFSADASSGKLRVEMAQSRSGKWIVIGVGDAPEK